MAASAALYELLCQHLLRRAPTGGAAAALQVLVYGGTYVLVLGGLWWMGVTDQLFDLGRSAH